MKPSRSFPVFITSTILCTVLACDRLPTPAEAQIQERPSRTSYVTPSSDTIALTYICGNHFRLTHTSASLPDTAFRWATTSGDSGAVQLYRRLPGHTYTEAVFTTSAADSAYISGLSGSLREGNGGLPNCTPPRDTVWPMAGSAAIYREHVDTSILMSSGMADDTVFARTVLARPLPGLSRDTLAKYLASIGVRVSARMSGGMLILHVDQLRADYSSHIMFVDSLATSSFFDFAAPVLLSEGLRVSTESRFPVESGSFTRSNWLSRNSTLWPYLSSRLDLAWSCETGTYGGQPASIVFYEGMPLLSHADIDAGRVSSHHTTGGLPSGSRLQSVTSPVADAQTAHALAVTGMALALGDNGTGITGVVWNGRGAVVARNLHLSGTWYYPPTVVDIADQLQVIRTLAPKVLNISSFTTARGNISPADKNLLVARFQFHYQELLDSLPHLSIVIAAGNDALTNFATFSSTSGSGPFPAEHIALYKLRDLPQYADRIVVATATSSSGTKPNFANYFSGKVDIGAPGAALKVLNYPALSFPDTASGTSFSAPLVAGVMALQYTMDSSLTPAQAKQQLLAGAAFRKGRDGSGNVINASTISGTSIYPLDAYGTLMHTSARTGGLPLCGVTAAFGEGSIRFSYHVDGTERGGPSAAFSGSHGPLAIAPGGRKLAINISGVHQTWTASLSAGSWSVSGPVDSTWKLYTPEDTVTITFLNDTLTVGVMHDSTALRVSSLVIPNALTEPTVPATGDWLFLVTRTISGTDPECSNGVNGVITADSLLWYPLRGSRQRAAIETDITNTCIWGGSSYPHFRYGFATSASEHADTALVLLGYQLSDTTSGEFFQRWDIGSTTPLKVGTTTAVSTDEYHQALSFKPGFGEFRTIFWSQITWDCVAQDRRLQAPTTSGASVSMTGFLDICNIYGMSSAARAIRHNPSIRFRKP